MTNGRPPRPSSSLRALVPHHQRAGREQREIRPDQRARTTADRSDPPGATWPVAGDAALRALYSEGYIMLTLLQLFSDNAAGRGALTYANPDLRRRPCAISIWACATRMQA